MLSPPFCLCHKSELLGQTHPWGRQGRGWEKTPTSLNTAESPPQDFLGFYFLPTILAGPSINPDGSNKSLLCSVEVSSHP